MAARFDYPQAEAIRDVLSRHSVRYLFIGKSGAILLGFPDTTQDADLFVEKTAANGDAMARALLELGFELNAEAAGRVKDRESLPRLKAFRDYWLKRR